MGAPDLDVLQLQLIPGHAEELPWLMAMGTPDHLKGALTTYWTSSSSTTHV